MLTSTRTTRKRFGTPSKQSNADADAAEPKSRVSPVITTNGYTGCDEK